MITKDGLYWTVDNTKVDVPVFSVSSGTDCVNAGICPFSVYRQDWSGLVIGRQDGYPKCYAQKTEDRFPRVLSLLRDNAYLVWSARDDHRHTKAMARNLSRDMATYAISQGMRYIRLNEAGDLSQDNIRFLALLCWELKEWGLIPYTYTKSPEILASQIRMAYCVVIRSEKDFVLVSSKSEAKRKGLEVCPAKGCGVRCTRCCEGLQTAVVSH